MKLNTPEEQAQLKIDKENGEDIEFYSETDSKWYHSMSSFNFNKLTYRKKKKIRDGFFKGLENMTKEEIEKRMPTPEEKLGVLNNLTDDEFSGLFPDIKNDEDRFDLLLDNYGKSQIVDIIDKQLPLHERKHVYYKKKYEQRGKVLLYLIDKIKIKKG